MLLRYSGYVSLSIRRGSEEPDEDGVPQTTLDWCLDLPCMYRAVRDDKRGTYTDGQHERHAYEVHIDHTDLPEGEVKRARLRTTTGVPLGTFPVQSVTELPLTGRIALDLGL